MLSFPPAVQTPQNSCLLPFLSLFLSHSLYFISPSVPLSISPLLLSLFLSLHLFFFQSHLSFSLSLFLSLHLSFTLSVFLSFSISGRWFQCDSQTKFVVVTQERDLTFINSSTIRREFFIYLIKPRARQYPPEAPASLCNHDHWQGKDTSLQS